jgi:glycosyltransferase involved in cell wall biosynthesis
MLGDVDLLVLSSYNEGQPIVVLEAMTAGIPTVGTEVGGMAQLISDPLTTKNGHTWQACGLLVTPGQTDEMADALQTVMQDRAMYEQFAMNARGRVVDFFQLKDAMAAYNELYRELGRTAGGPRREEDVPMLLPPVAHEPQIDLIATDSATSAEEKP